MSKKRQEKRRLKAKKNKRRQPPKQKIAMPGSAAPHSTAPSVPSAYTMWRSMNLEFRSQEALAEALAQFPPVAQRDSARVEQIQSAANIEALLDLTPIAIGLADHAWITRMREFGPAVAKKIAARLANNDWMHTHRKERSGIEERCIGTLRWYGEEGSDALLSCWDSLDDYGRSIASIALGLLGARQAADRIFDFYRKAEKLRGENYFVGALWGLIDLQDERAADALIDLLNKKRSFYELFGFFSLAGDRRAILPLFVRAVKHNRSSDEIIGDAMWALIGIAHRIGHTDFIEEMKNVFNPDESLADTLELLTNEVFKYTFENIKDHFELFYATASSELPVLPSPGSSRPEG